jgi:hypothetical protein
VRGTGLQSRHRRQDCSNRAVLSPEAVTTCRRAEGSGPLTDSNPNPNLNAIADASDADFRPVGRYYATICALERYRFMGKFDYDAPAELFASVGGMRSKGGVRYLRFDSAAQAIQHAIEQIPLAQRGRSVLEVGEERYEAATIQKLYVSTEYPLDPYPAVF